MLRQPRPVLALDAHAARLEPVVGQQRELLGLVGRPRVLVGDVEVAVALALGHEAVGNLARLEHLALVGLVATDGEVVLPALAAERQWHQHAVAARSWDVLLTAGRDVPRRRRIERGRERVAAAEELVQAEREDRETGVVQRFAASHQRVLQRFGAAFEVYARLLTEERGSRAPSPRSGRGTQRR